MSNIQWMAMMITFGLCSSSMVVNCSKIKDKTEIQKALDWLLMQRNHDYGWGDGLDTAQAVLAIELTKTGTILERKLSAKQLQIELILNLWYNIDEDMVFPSKPEKLTIGNIAIYSLALISTCQDPRYFHGHDLIGSLLHHEPVSDYEFGLSSLAACKAGAHVRKRHLRRLMEIANTKHAVDTLSMTILALQCVERDHRNRNVKSLLKKPLASLEALQEPDGGFGSLHATAVAMQALQECKAIWNRTEAVNWLIDHQGPDGAFFDVSTTAEVIIALANVGIHALKDENCKDFPKTNNTDMETAVITPYVGTKSVERNLTTVTSNTTKGAEIGTEKTEISAVKNITVSYSLWVGSNITEVHFINITVNHSATFYEIMERAAQIDERYEFSASEWPNGHYVHTLYGYKEEPMSYHYWLLYRLTDFPDSKNPPSNQLVAPTGVDDLIVQDGEHYLFWYKKL